MKLRAFILFLLCLFPILSFGQTSKTGRIDVGLNAAKPAACSPGDVFATTDTFQVYNCGPANTWTPIGGAAASPSGSLQYNNSGAFGGVAGSAVTTGGDITITGSTPANLVWKHTPGYIATGTNDPSPLGIIADNIAAYGTTGYTHALFNFGGSTNDAQGVTAVANLLEFSGVTGCNGDGCASGSLNSVNADVASSSSPAQVDGAADTAVASYSSGHMSIVGSSSLAEDFSTSTGSVDSLIGSRNILYVGHHAVNAFAFEALSPFNLGSVVTPPTLLGAFHCQEQDSGNAIGAGNTSCFYIDDQGSGAAKWGIFEAGLNTKNVFPSVQFPDAANTHYAHIKNPGTLSSDYNFNLPTTAGTAGQCYQSGGGGSTPNTWGTCGTGNPGGSNTQIQFNSSGTFGASSQFTYASGATNQLSLTNATQSTGAVDAGINLGGSDGDSIALLLDRRGMAVPTGFLIWHNTTTPSASHLLASFTEAGQLELNGFASAAFPTSISLDTTASPVAGAADSIQFIDLAAAGVVARKDITFSAHTSDWHEIEDASGAIPYKIDKSGAIIINPTVVGPIATTSLNTGGTGYAVNDTGTFIVSNTGQGATYIITSVSGGVVTGYTVTAPGTSYAVHFVAGVTGGAQPGVGTGFAINVLTISGTTPPTGITTNRLNLAGSLLTGVQGTDSNVLTSGTMGGSNAALCEDANSGASTCTILPATLLSLTETTAPTGGSSIAQIWADSTTHWPKFNPNNAGAVTVAGITGAIIAGHCAEFTSPTTIIDNGSACGSGGTGTVTNFTAGNLSPLFTTSVATAATTPALTFALSTAGAHTFYMNNTSGTATPGFQTAGEADLPATTVFTDQNATFGAHSYNFSTATILKPPAAAGFASTANDFGLNTTTNNWQFWSNGANKIAGMWSAAPTNGHCVTATVSAGNVLLSDSGTVGCGGTPPTIQTDSVNNTSQSTLNFTDTAGASGISFTNPSGGVETATLTSVTGGGNAVAQMTAVGPQQGDYVGYNGSTNLVNLRPGVIINKQVGTSYTIASDPGGDRGSSIIMTNAAAMAVTLPQAGSVGYASSFYFSLTAAGGGAVTITPGTSTINGASTLVLLTGMSASITSDNTNYFARVTGYGSGTTGSIGGAIVGVGCDTGTVTINGATTSMVPVVVASTSGAPGAGFTATGQVTGANTVTVSVCAPVSLTPTSSTYIVRLLP